MDPSGLAEQVSDYENEKYDPSILNYQDDGYAYVANIYVDQPGTGEDHDFVESKDPVTKELVKNLDAIPLIMANPDNRDNGHTFLGVRKIDADGNIVEEKIRGLYPLTPAESQENEEHWTNDNLKKIPFTKYEVDFTADGILINDKAENHKFEIKRDINISSGQYKKINEIIKDWDKGSKKDAYNLRSYNCTTWVIDTLAKVGIDLNSGNKNPVLFPGNYPGTFGESLRSGKIRNWILDPPNPDLFH